LDRQTISSSNVNIWFNSHVFQVSSNVEEEIDGLSLQPIANQV